MFSRREIITSCGLAIVGILMPSVAFGQVMPRSWYGWSFSITRGEVKTPSRYYDGNNIGIEMTCYSRVSSKLEVSCWTAAGSQIGRAATFSSPGFSKATWGSRGPGTYYFKIAANNENAETVTSDDVQMYSW